MSNLIPFTPPQEVKPGQLKLCYLCGDAAGPAWHDCYVPATYLNKKKLIYADLMQMDINLEKIYDFDIVVMQRQLNPMSFMLLRDLQHNGKVVGYNFCDNFWNLPPNNPAKAVYGDGKLLRNMEEFIKTADFVTIPTDGLVDIVKNLTDRWYKVTPLVDTDISNYIIPGRKDKQIRIGWTSTPHHEDDSRIIAHALGEIARQYSNVRIILFGYINAMMKNLIPNEQIEFYNGVHVWDYESCLGAMDLDIGIAPIAFNSFNFCKSHRKWYEYSILNIATICTDFETYKNVEHMKTGYKVKKNKHINWVKGLKYLIENPKERKNMAKEAYKYVIKNHSANTKIKLWADMYTEVYEKKHGGTK